MKKYLPLFLIISTIIILTGTSYALLRSSQIGTNSYVINTGLLEVSFLDSNTDSLNITNMVPMSDEEGINQSDELEFTIKNTGVVKAKYDIYIEETSSNLEFKEVIKYIVNKNNKGYQKVKVLSDDKYIDEDGHLTISGEASYKVKIWLGSEAGNEYMNKTFKAKIIVNSEQYVAPPPNEPVLLDNMIPVYYEATSDTAGVWKVADKNNSSSTYKWYNYGDYMWANAVTVKETGTKTREEYLQAATGTEISMEDITTMWVWIPRYKYTIWAGNNETSEEQLIDIEFENGISKTGTVSCADNILTSDTSSSSETCTDTTNGSIINGKSTYTHPAFTFGDEELTGFWYAKFEMSTDQTSTCGTSPSNTNCNITGQNIYIKPDQISLRYIYLSNMFVNIRNMELYNNVHGFNQSSSATTSSSQTGEITGDNNNYDIHMQKNMEWGAVTYLAYSEYGKYGNSMYEGNSKRVYKNNYNSSLNNVYTYKTGYSGYSYNATISTTNTTLYNDLTNLGSGQGYKGAGASTTGTIYGVYDMNGGAYEYTMGNMVNSSGSFYSSSSAFNSTPLAKYYDKYSYRSNSAYSQDYVARGKLGDATKEMTNNFTSSGSASWEGRYRFMPYSGISWFNRGGNAYSSNNFGLSFSNGNNGSATDDLSSRSVLVVAH